MKGQLEGIPLRRYRLSLPTWWLKPFVGARFVEAVNVCLEHNMPLVCFSASGGARMQEALMSLMQMAKTSAALAKMSEKGLPFISVLMTQQWVYRLL